MNDKVKYFLGANSHRGFVSYFGQLQSHKSDDLQLLILKGGPGSGKSSLMKRVSGYARGLGNDLEYIPCASDPESLDAFVDKTRGFAMMDGTAPHVTDPFFPGARQHIMYTGDGWDCAKLSENAAEIQSVSALISDCHKGAGAYISAAAALLRENMAFSERYISRGEIFSFASELISAISENGVSGSGEEHKRLLSAVSVGETVFFDDTLRILADRIYAVDDRWGAAAAYLMQLLCEGAKGSGIDIITCRCSVLPERIEHIIFPTEGFAITTANAFHSAHRDATAIINGMYSDIPDESALERRLGDASRMIDRACGAVAEAKSLHDELEKYYIDAMDFSENEKKYNEIIDRFYR